MWTLPAALVFVLLTARNGAQAYEVPFVYGDKSMQACSGMWAGRNTFINVTLDQGYSTGQMEMLIFEAADEQYIGRPHQSTVASKTYFCNPWDIKGGVCTEEERGHFLFNLPSGMSLSNTSIQTTRLVFSSIRHNVYFDSRTPLFASPDLVQYKELGQVPLIKPNDDTSFVDQRPFSAAEIVYADPVQYPVRNTGYYCVAYAPVLPAPPYKHPIIHSYYKGIVKFHNGFAGKLPAADYAKLVFYAVIFSLYSVATLIWGSLYWRNRTNTLPIHTSLSVILVFADLYTLLMLAHFVAMNSTKRGHPSSILHLIAHVVRASYYTSTLAVLLLIGHGLTLVGGDKTFGTLAKASAFSLSMTHMIFGTLYAYGMILGLEYHVNQVVLKTFTDFLVPLEVATAVFISWFVIAWIGTLKRMTSRTMRVVHSKVILTAVIFILALVVYLALHVYFLYQSAHGVAHRHVEAVEWQLLWLIDGPAAGWREMVYMPAFLLTLWLWRPSNRNFVYKEVSQIEGAEATEGGTRVAVGADGEEGDA